MSWRIPDAIRAQIAARPPTDSRSYLAGVFNVSEVTIQNIRRQHGVKCNPRGWPKVWDCPLHRAHGKPIGWPCKPRNPAPLDWALDTGASESHQLTP